MSRLREKRGRSGKGVLGTVHSTLLHTRVSSFNRVFALVLTASLSFTTFD